MATWYTRPGFSKYGPKEFGLKMSGPPTRLVTNPELKVEAKLCISFKLYKGKQNALVHGLRTPIEGINQRNLKIGAYVAFVCSHVLKTTVWT